MIAVFRRNSSCDEFRRRGALLACLCVLLGSGCTYLGQVKAQRDYEQSHRHEPKLATAKHILQEPTFFVYGRIEGDSADHSGAPVVVLAVSNDLQPDEIVDVFRLGRSGSFYGMNLPEGNYHLVMATDRNRDGTLQVDEIDGSTTLSLDEETYPGRVAANMDLEGDPQTRITISTFPVHYGPAESRSLERSLFYPEGTLRALDDSIFSRYMSELGMYDPSAFMEMAPLMFYALEEDSPHKVPVIFVHGMGGTAADFESMVERLDRDRYAAWFFHYPSGLELGRLSQLFYDIFLSGQIIPPSETPCVIVAHSMGGLIVRDALNLHLERNGQRKVGLFVTLASPFGGIESAAVGVARAPLVVPAWRDLAPGSSFIENLFRKSLCGQVQHRVFFCALTDEDVAKQEGSDGVVPVDSQLSSLIRAGGPSITGIRSSHSGVLSHPVAVEQVNEWVSEIRSPLPEPQLQLISKGGFVVESELQSGRYSAMELHILKTFGYLLRALANGEVAPASSHQEHFIATLKHQVPAQNPAETGWAKFVEDFPELAK